MDSSLIRFCALLGSGMLCLTSCGPDKKADATQSSPTSAGSGAAAPGDGGSKTASAKTGGASVKEEPADVPPKGPATSAEAAQMLDLNKVAVVEGADSKATERTIANLTYKAKAGLKDTFEFHRKQLLDHRWKELPNSYVTDQSASATFARNTFHVSLSVMPDSTPGTVMVMIHNHGNVNLSKLPKPATQKNVYEGEIAAMYVAADSVAATADACKKLMLADGWEPYGGAGDSANYKKNAVLVGVTVSAAPAEGGKTMISFSKDMMSYDLPAPPNAEDVRYVDNLRRLTFETAAENDAVADFYKERLAKSGWKPNEPKLMSVDDKFLMVFREPGGGLLFLNVGKDRNGKRSVEVAGTTMAEFDEASKRAKEKAVEYVKKKEEEAKKPRPKVAVAVPAGAEHVRFEKAKLEFNLPSGKAQALAESWRKQYQAEGWKEDRANMTPQFGSIALSKGDQNQSLSINYTDSGVTPAEFTIYTINVDLEQH
jgi:hypothetical protein